MSFIYLLCASVLLGYGFIHSYQFGCGILKMMGPKKQVFWPKINILKGNHCNMKIGGAPVRQRLGMILENKVVQKL